MKTRLPKRGFHHISLFILLITTMVLPVAYLSIKPAATHGQTAEPLGRFTFSWRLTLTGTYEKHSSYEDGDSKGSEDLKENISVESIGEMKGDILDPDLQGKYDSLSYSTTGSGGMVTTEQWQLKENCREKPRIGIGNGVEIYTDTYNFRDNPEFARSYYPDLYITPSHLPQEVHFSVHFFPEYAWQNSVASHYSYTHTDPCGAVDSNVEDYLYDWGSLNTPATEALGAASSDEEYQKQFYGWAPRVEGNLYRITKTATYQYNDQGLVSNGSYTTTGTVRMEYTLTYDHTSSPMEVVMIAPDEYEQWLPEGKATETAKGNDITVQAELRDKRRPDQLPEAKAKFTFQLVNTSQEQGVCLNVPPEADQNNPPDLKFDPADNPDFTISDNGQTATAKKSDYTARIVIGSYDWGGRTHLKVIAVTDDDNQEQIIGHLENNRAKETLDLPQDDNNNMIGDAWERAQQIYDQNLPAEWNDIDVPGGQKAPGDGISLYERYRGFEFESSYNPADPKLKHERLKPNRKYVFIRDPADLVLSTATDPVTRDMNFIQISGFVVRFLADNQWSGSGQFGDQKRIVNFNHGSAHIADQHGLELRANFGSSIIDPMTGEADPESADKITLGTAWDDTSSPRPMQDSPANSYIIDIFLSNIDEKLNDLLIYHTLGLPQFGGKDYNSLTEAEKKQLETEATSYFQSHQDEYKQAFLKQQTSIVSHELGHGLGVHHHRPTTAGSKECVMRYFEELTARRPEDRFELRARSWPDKYCTSPDNTFGGKGCRIQIKATDKGKR